MSNSIMTEELWNEIWAGDQLRRKSDAKFIIQFFENRLEEREAQGLPRSYVLNLNASWGNGKTFFLERFAKSLDAEGHLVAYINAWKDDHSQDPLLAVMSAIDLAISPLVKTKRIYLKKLHQLKKNAGTIALAAAKGAALNLGKRAIGEGMEEIAQALQSSDTIADSAKSIGDKLEKELQKILDERAGKLIESFRQDQKTIESFSVNLTELLNSIAADKTTKLPFFVLVDELDRCRPHYAITLLERVKHLFNTDGVVFIVATDTHQLCHVISAVYGTNFESRRYLARFFDQTYEFSEPTREEFVNFLLEKTEFQSTLFVLPRDTDLSSCLVSAFSFFDVSLRDIEQCIDLLHSIATVWARADLPLNLPFLLPLVIANQLRIPLSLKDSSLVEALQAQRSSRGANWTYDFGYASDAYGETRKVTCDGLDLFEQIRTSLNIPLPKLLENRNDDHRGRWTYAQFTREFMALHKGSYRGEGPNSYLSRYPDMVRTAGNMRSFDTE